MENRLVSIYLLVHGQLCHTCKTCVIFLGVLGAIQKCQKDFMSVQTVHFFRAPPFPLKCTDQHFWVPKQGSYAAQHLLCNNKSNPSSEPALWQMIPLAVYYELQITANIVFF